jgi:diketogulonate reductase-like aldo/keto reductase
MLKRRIPSTDEMLPVIGCGTWQTFDVGASAEERQPLRDVVCKLLEGGGAVIDSSPMYGRSEAVTGDLVSELGARDRTFLATKVWTRGRDAGIAQMSRSLDLLKTPRLDLLQIHNLLDWKTHLATLRDWKASGRVRYVGITHYSGTAHADLEAIMRTEAIDFVQFNYALNDRAAERKLLPLAAERGIAVLINRPFGQGSLLRSLSRHSLPDFAAEIGCESWAELALKYLIANEAVTCVVPATRDVAHMARNIRAASDSIPDREMRRRIVAAAGF